MICGRTYGILYKALHDAVLAFAVQRAAGPAVPWSWSAQMNRPVLAGGAASLPAQGGCSLTPPLWPLPTARLALEPWTSRERTRPGQRVGQRGPAWTVATAQRPAACPWLSRRCIPSQLREVYVETCRVQCPHVAGDRSAPSGTSVGLQGHPVPEVGGGAGVGGAASVGSDWRPEQGRPDCHSDTTVHFTRAAVSPHTPARVPTHTHSMGQTPPSSSVPKPRRPSLCVIFTEGFGTWTWATRSFCATRLLAGPLGVILQSSGH